MSTWWRSVEPAAKDPILGVTEAFLADPSPDKVNVGVVSFFVVFSSFLNFPSGRQENGGGEEMKDEKCCRYAERVFSFLFFS